MDFLFIVAVTSNPNLQKQKLIINFLTKDTGLIPKFPSYDIENPSFDLKSALNQIKTSNFVLADLTYERPSCYYELGLAEALTKPVHAIAQSGTKIHQTASRDKVIFYDDMDQFELVIKNIFIHNLKIINNQ